MSVPSLLRRLLAATVLSLALAPSAHASMTLGINDDVFVNPSLAPPWLLRAQSLGSQHVRVTVRWKYVVPERLGGGFVPTDPGSPGYRWDEIDLAVDRARAAGQSIMLQVVTAPSWAEGTGRRPAGLLPGVWKPDPDELANFMTALATRYRGRAEAYQVWNEPNLPVYLAPQWRKVSGRFVPASPAQYREMLNASYAAVKAADPGALVVQAGTAPYGEPKAGGRRMAPRRFVRSMLSRPTTVDVVSHHPYGVASPFEKAFHADDVTMADLGNLVAVWRSAEAAGRLLPRGPHARWATEFGWESTPDPSVLSQNDQARYLADGAAALEAAGFTRGYWYLVRDEARGTDWRRSAQSGLFRRGGAAKPAAKMFTFPLSARPRGSRTAVFALPPVTSRCQLRRGDVVVKSLSCTARTPLRTSVVRRRGGRLTLVAGTARSPVVRER